MKYIPFHIYFYCMMNWSLYFLKKINCLFTCLIFINLFNYYNYTILLKFSFLTPERWNIAFTCFSNLVISSLFPLKSNYLHTFKNWLKYYSNSKNTFFWYFLSASLSLFNYPCIHKGTYVLNFSLLSISKFRRRNNKVFHIRTVIQCNYFEIWRLGVFPVL